jgi:hypothetical protein
MKKSEEIILKQYAKTSKITWIIWILNFTILPLLVIFVLAVGENSTLQNIMMIFGTIYLVLAISVLFIIRRCPNCHTRFSRYVFNPAKCPYCKVRLR